MPTTFESSAGIENDLNGREEDGEGRNRARDYEHIRSHLFDATRGVNQYLSEKTAGKWWKEALSNRSPDTFFNVQLQPRMKKWQQMRRSYDNTVAEMEPYGKSANPPILKPTQFWKLSGKEREAYLRKAEEFLKKQSTLGKRLTTLRETTFKEFVKITHGRLKASSNNDIQKLQTGLKHVSLDENEIAGWEAFLKNGIASAQSLYGRMMNQLITAQLSEHIISARVVKNLKNKFKDTNVDFKQKELYIDVLLPERLREWRRIKGERDTLAKNPDVKKLKGVPRLAVFMNESQFVELEYPERLALYEEVDTALDSSVKMETISSPTKYARYQIGNHDYDGAEQTLMTAKQKDPENQDIPSLLNYLEQLRRTELVDEEVETSDPEAIMARARHTITHRAPTGAKKTYQMLAQKGYKTLASGCQMIYNRKWVREHGYSTNKTERMHAESETNKSNTQDHIENGHTPWLEHNILEGDTANKSAIRDECHKAQLLHISSEGVETAVNSAELNQNNHLHRYWTTWNLKDVTYEAQDEFIVNCHYQLKQDIKKLNEMGYDFTIAGPLKRKGGGVAEPLKKNKPKMPSPPTGMAG